MLDDLFDAVGGTAGRLLGIGLLVGTGVVIGRGVRPAAKGAIRGYLSMAERVRELSAEATESLQDLYAEAKAEHEEEMTSMRPTEAGG
jgi:hypothetical protein